MLAYVLINLNESKESDVVSDLKKYSEAEEVVAPCSPFAVETARGQDGGTEPAPRSFRCRADGRLCAIHRNPPVQSQNQLLFPLDRTVRPC